MKINWKMLDLVPLVRKIGEPEKKEFLFESLPALTQRNSILDKLNRQGAKISNAFYRLVVRLLFWLLVAIAVLYFVNLLVH